MISIDTNSRKQQQQQGTMKSVSAHMFVARFAFIFANSCEKKTASIGFPLRHAFSKIRTSYVPTAIIHDMKE
jgi:hypothetical protein